METIKFINEDEYLTLDIRNDTYQNLNLPKEEYLNLYSLYMYYFTKYLIKTIRLDQYDESLKNSNLSFVNIIENQDVYQLMNSSLLNYFYIRNNIYLDKLTNDELNFLKQQLTSLNYNINEEIESFIEKTYKKLIFETINNNPNMIAKISHGPISSSAFFSRNDALVIGFRYDEFNLNGKDEKTWHENYKNQRYFRCYRIFEII